MKNLTVVSLFLMLGIGQTVNVLSVQAQQRSNTLNQTWTDGNGFTSVSWSFVEDGEEIYSSAVYTEINQNTLNIYNTYQLDPFGKYARCGGLGCDLGKGQLIATLKFESKGSSFVVKEASGNASFLKGSQCKLVESYLKVLECTSTQNPSGNRMPSIFRFSPGS